MTDNNYNHLSTSQRMDNKGSNRNLYEHSPDSDLFKKYCSVLGKVSASPDKNVPDNDLFKALIYMKECTKKTKYQLKVLDLHMIQNVFIPIMYMKGNVDNTVMCIKIFLNIAKNKNNHYKLTPEDSIMKELLNLLIIYLNSNLTTYILKILFHLTENKEFLNKLRKIMHDPRDFHTGSFVEKDHMDIRNLKSVDLAGFTRVFTEKILDDLSSHNKQILLKSVHNIYTYNSSYMNAESVEPIMRCLGDKEPETTVVALRLILFYAKDKIFHQHMINNNFIFRLVRIYKQGVVEMDVILVQILLIFFENKTLHDLLFESKIVLILESYLNSFDSDHNEEVLRNVFEIFKEIIKIPDKDAKGNNKVNKNPIKEDPKLQIMIFTKALGLASGTKKEKSILSCISTINLMLTEYTSNLLKDEEHVKKMIELMPNFFKSKDLEILKYSLSIFEEVVSKKHEYFLENYAKSNDKTFNIKSLVHCVINLINEFFPNYEVLKKSCHILIQLSDNSLLHNFFLQEPQITIIRVFNDDLIDEKIKLIKEIERLTLKKLIMKRKSQLKEAVGGVLEGNRRVSKKESFSSLENVNISPIPQKSKGKVLKKPKAHFQDEKEEEYLKEFEKRLLDNKEILQSSIQIVANLTRYSENLEILTKKGFLEIINKMLVSHNLDALPFIAKCIQGFCGSSSSIEIILNYHMMQKILKLFKLLKDNNLVFEDKREQKKFISAQLISFNKMNEEELIYEKISAKLEVLISLRNIIESDIKLQRQFILDEGINTLLCEVNDKSNKLSEKSVDQLNSMILKVLYVISCNINKLFIIFNKGELEIDDVFECSEDKEFSSADDKDSDGSHLDSETKKKYEIEKRSVSSEDNENSNEYINVFKKQLSQNVFMEKLLSIGYFDITSLQTYKELIKILINLYLNRYYLKYFTTDGVFEKVMSIMEKILTKYMTKRESNYDIIKLILIFLKFICEEENLIKRFLESRIISHILNIINTNEFAEVVEKEELGQFYYNTSLVLLRLTEFKGHTERLDFIKNLFNILENLYDINYMNGKIYIINILKNILTEKNDFFVEDDIVRLINKMVTHSGNFIIYEFVELMKIVVHNRSLTKRMENVFKYLIEEIKSAAYSPKFKKKILELILCLSYENSNIKDFALQDLLILVKNLDITINKKTTLLILMNFSSVSSNFSYLQMTPNKGANSNSMIKKAELSDSTANIIEQVDGMTIKKRDLINIINHLLDSDRFSQILIQRLLINITSIDNIDLSIISQKILNVIIEIISTNRLMQESIIIFSLSILINISNRNILKMDLNKEDMSKEDINEISEENNKCEEESLNSSIINRYKDNVKNTEESKSNESNNINLQDIFIVDYILSKLPDIISIFNDLFARNNIDIASLTIMFACNLSRKIILSSQHELEEQITKCIEDFFIKNWSKSVLESDSGKFFVVSIIKYCISLSSDEKKVIKYKGLFENIFNLFLDEDKQIKLFKLSREDIANTTVNFILVESQMKLLNIMIEIHLNLNIFENFNIVNSISLFFYEFIKDFSDLFHADLQAKEFNVNLQEMILASFKILISFMKNDNFEYEKISSYIFLIIINILSYEPNKFNEDLKSYFVYLLYVLICSGLDKNELNTNLELKKWLIEVFKIPSNTRQTDFHCLKLFTKSIHDGKLPDIFWQSNKFLRKLDSYLFSETDVEEDEKLTQMKKETEKILNVISFDQLSHPKIHSLGIYNYFKTNLYIKFNPAKNHTFSKDDVIFIVNFILNNENHEIVKDDITTLLKHIFLCKELSNNVKVHLFDIFVTYTLEKQLIKVFKEDYLIIFNLLYDNLRVNFSDMIFLVDNFTKKYNNFSKQLVSDDSIMRKVFEDFLNFDKKFPSHYEELNSFFKILEIFIINNPTDTILLIIRDIFQKINENGEALRNVSILNTVMGFLLFSFMKICEVNDLSNNENEMTEMVKTYYFNDLIDIVLKNSVADKELDNIYIVTSMILQSEYKHILSPLKSLNSFLFGKEFMVSFFENLIPLETLDIREFVYVIHLAMCLLSFGTIECLEGFLMQLLNIYEKFLLKSGKEFSEVELSDIVSSLYFFSDLFKNVEISHTLFYKFLKFIINVLTTISITVEQKEILIKYYHEILTQFKLTAKDDLNLVFTFLLKIHYDQTLNFIENSVIETVITNTPKELIPKNFDSFQQMLSLTVSADINEFKIMQFFKFIKQIALKFKPPLGSNSNMTFIKELKTYFVTTVKKLDKEIKQFEDLTSKKEKLIELLK